MKILFGVGRLIPPLYIGGAEVSLRLLSKKLTSKNHSLRIIGCSSHPRHGESEVYSQYILNELARNNISVHVIGDGHYVYIYNGSICEIVPKSLLEARFEECLLQDRPDLVITMLESAACFVKISKRHSIKVALWVHDVFQDNINTLGSDPSIVLYTSEYVKKRCEAEYSGKGVVLYPPFEYLGISKDDIIGQRQFITMVNPIPEKGGRIFIALAKEMRGRLFYAVEGWRRSELMDDGLPDNIIYIERMDDLTNLWRNTSILLVPSNLCEGFGRVVVEAGYFGIPSIVLNNGGLPEALGYGGIVLKENNLEEWRNAINRIESNINIFRINAYINSLKYDIDHESIISHLF